MWETWVITLGWEDPLEKGKATHSSILGVAKSQIQLSDFHFQNLKSNLITPMEHLLMKKMGGLILTFRNLQLSKL